MNSTKLRVTVFLAVFAILLYIVADIYLFTKLDVLKEHWDKALFLYKGIEAIALAAAGFLFGREVHRDRAEKAEERADRNEQGVKNGHLLAGAVKNAAQQAFTTAATATPAATARTTPQTGLTNLEKLADRLFPSG
jgi:hypothetical protein